MKVTAQMRDEYETAHGRKGTDEEVWNWYFNVKLGDVAEEDLHLFGVEQKTDEHSQAYQNIIDMIQADRQNDYGDAGASFDNIAEFWTAYIKRKFGFDIFKPDEKLDRTDVAVMMMLLKASRFAFQRKHDSVLDMASYADFALKFTEE